MTTHPAVYIIQCWNWAKTLFHPSIELISRIVWLEFITTESRLHGSRVIS